MKTEDRFALVVAAFLLGALLYACATARMISDLAALELSCVDNAATKQESIDCRNAVRLNWAKQNEAGVVLLEGGSHD